LDLVVLDLRPVASFTDFFVITRRDEPPSGTSHQRRRRRAVEKNGTLAARVEGYQTAEWILVDYGDFIVHVFDETARRFYDLERLWREAVRVAVPPDQFRAAGSLREQ